MINTRLSRSSDGASDLVAAVLSNVGALEKQAPLLCGDVRRRYKKIDATHRAADRLHRKVATTRARIRTLRSADRLRRRKRHWAATAHKLVNLLQIGLTPFSKV
jgi:hypothetical protein